MNKFITIPFTEPYLDKLSDILEKDYLVQGKDLSRVALVFGGKRPRLFLNRTLARRTGGAFIPQKVFTINEFISFSLRHQEEFTALPEMEDSYLIYQLACEHTPQICKDRESFAAFLPWAREILQFIDHLDLEDINDAALQNIQANAVIGYPVPDDINRLLQHLVTLRKVYHAALLRRRQYSRGFQYHRAAEVIRDVKLPEFDEIIVCNFFYFHQTEEIIMKELLERGQARFVFQGDERKWPVLERIGKKFSCSLREGKEPPIPAFDLKLYEGFDSHSQAATVREILAGIPDHERAVIVLPQPANLLPLMTEISQSVKEFNISMGYPLKRSSLYSLLTGIFRVQRSRREDVYYARDYLKVLQHPFIKNLKLGEDPAVCRILIHRIEEILTGQHHAPISGRLFLDLDDVIACDDVYMLVQETLDRLGISVDRPQLQAMMEELHELLFHGWEKAGSFNGLAGCLRKLLDALTRKSFMHQFPLNLNIAARVFELIEEFGQVAFGEEKFEQEDLFRIFDEKISREIVAFQGSPLKGLQILGLFETRSLNFDHVIVLDVNEGVLPTLNLYEPLIPREVMISLNLDRLELEEEIQRYQFMRLISSAKNVHLVYQANKESERSRFIEELIWEAEKNTGRPDSVSLRRTGFNVRVSRDQRAAKKTPEILEHLRSLKFSATSLNAYLKNPYDFYLRYCLGLKEKDDLLDEPEARQVGTFIHDLLEQSYRPFLDRAPVIDPDFRVRFARAFEHKFTEVFGRSMGSDAFLLKAVLAERLKRFLDTEEEKYQGHIAKVLYLEQVFEETIPLSAGKIRFKYIVDRVDLLKNGTVMIIDYKTGLTNLLPKSVDRVAGLTLSREAIRDQVKSFQVPLYFHYLTKNFPDQPVDAALYNLQTLKMDRFIDQKRSTPPEEINAAFLRALDFIVSEILDPNIDFIEDAEAMEEG